MMMCVCELEEEHIELLGDVQDALEQKTVCNIAIDDVCSQECEEGIAKRHEATWIWRKKSHSTSRNSLNIMQGRLPDE